MKTITISCLSLYCVVSAIAGPMIKTPGKTTPNPALKQYSCSPPFVEAGTYGCFYLGSDEGYFVDNYDAAVMFCEGHGGKLAIVETEAKNIFLRDQFILGGSDDKTLLGAKLNAENDWKWWDGRLVVDGFLNWDEGQPSGNGECMGYSAEHNYEWDDIPCDNYVDSDLHVSYLCEEKGTIVTTTANDDITCPPNFELVGDGCYYFNTDNLDSFDAMKTTCENDGGNLAVTKTRDQTIALGERYLSESISEHKVLLAARLNDEGEFAWPDGLLVNDGFDMWASDQPSGNGECMGFSKEHDFFWDDFICEDYAANDLTVGFICEAA